MRKKVEKEQERIVAEKTASAKTKKAAAEAAQAKANKLNTIAGAAIKKLNDAKKHQLEVAAAAKLKEEAEEKTVAAKTHLAEKIKAAADKSTHEANVKKAAAESMLKKIDNAKCTKHAGCRGLTGYCCPTLNTNKMHLGSTRLDGENLGCCGAVAEIELAETIGDSVADTNASSSLAEWFTRRRRYYGGYRRRRYYGGYRRRRSYGARCQYCPYSYTCHSNSGRRYRCHPSTPYYFRGRCYRSCPGEVDDLAATEKNSQETLIEDEDLTNEDDEDDEEQALNSAPLEEPTTEFGTSMWIAFVGSVVGAVISASVAVRWRPRTIVQTPILGA